MMCMLMHAMHGDHDQHQTEAHSPDESLLEVLKRRFAQGEINEAQFEQMKRVLGLTAPAQADTANAPAGHHQG